MSSAMDMSLDDVISASKGAKGHGDRDERQGGDRGREVRRQRGGGAGGAMRRGGGRGRGGARSAYSPNGRRPYQQNGRPQYDYRCGGGRGRLPRGDINAAWKHDLFGKDAAANDGLKITVNKSTGRSNNNDSENSQRRIVAVDADAMALDGDDNNTTPLSPTRQPRTPGFIVEVENLFYEVTEQELKDLFGAVGPLKRARIQYDAAGRSRGTATVVFEQEADAQAAVSKYNGADLDGQVIKLEFKGEEKLAFRPNNRDANRQQHGQRSHPYGGSGGGSRDRKP